MQIQSTVALSALGKSRAFLLSTVVVVTALCLLRGMGVHVNAAQDTIALVIRSCCPQISRLGGWQYCNECSPDDLCDSGTYRRPEQSEVQSGLFT